MGAFAAVAQGSYEEPALITLRYRGPGASGPVLGLVGKGVTFDSGGISLKPSAKMSEMKFDMSGAASVLEGIGAIARLELPLDVIAVLGATENLPSGRSVKPGDIVTAANGTTIEVNNTDAEGRLVLADCLWHAIEQGAERVVDLATLTGAVIVALGSTYSGLMSNDEELAERIVEAGERSGEIVWRLPLHEEYDELIKGTFGDLNNAPEAPQGGHDRGRRVPAEVRRRGPVGAPGHRRLGLGAGAPLRGQGGLGLRRAPARRAGPLLLRLSAGDGLRPLPRPRADQAHRARVRRGRGGAGGGGARPHASPSRTRSCASSGALNLMGIPFPTEYGGAGGDTLAYVLTVEELTRVDSSVAITLCAHTSLGTQPLYLFGNEDQKREWMPRLCSGEVLGAFGLTEPEAGSDAGNTRTRARLQDGEWVIDGAKQFITNAGTDISGVVCITAVTGEEDGGAKEISNIIVPNGTPGYEQGEPYRKMGWNASDTRPLTFSECRVPEENLLGQRGAGFRQFLQILDIGRIGVAAMGVGLAQGALDQALAYARERRAFGQPISKFQAIQAKLADMSTEIEAARLLVYKAALEKDAGRNFGLTAAQAKLKTGRLAVRCSEEAVQIHGGYGYIEEYPVCRFYRDAKILTIGEGTDEIQQMVIARALGA